MENGSSVGAEPNDRSVAANGPGRSQTLRNSAELDVPRISCPLCRKGPRKGAVSTSSATRRYLEPAMLWQKTNHAQHGWRRLRPCLLSPAWSCMSFAKVLVGGCQLSTPSSPTRPTSSRTARPYPRPFTLLGSTCCAALHCPATRLGMIEL